MNLFFQWVLTIRLLQSSWSVIVGRILLLSWTISGLLTVFCSKLWKHVLFVVWYNWDLSWWGIDVPLCILTWSLLPYWCKLLLWVVSGSENSCSFLEYWFLCIRANWCSKLSFLITIFNYWFFLNWLFSTLCLCLCNSTSSSVLLNS